MGTVTTSKALLGNAFGGHRNRLRIQIFEYAVCYGSNYLFGRDGQSAVAPTALPIAIGNHRNNLLPVSTMHAWIATTAKAWEPAPC